MPIKIGKLTGQVHRIAIKVQIEENGEITEEALNVGFRPITPKLLRELTALNNSNGNGNKKAPKEEKSGLVQELARLVVDLDAVDESGQPVKPTEDILDTIDLKVLRAISTGIWAYTFPNEQT